MRKVRETSGSMSRLPEDNAYWGALTDRLVRDAAGRLRSSGSTRTRWWSGLARFSMPLTVGAVAAMIAALYWLPPHAGEPARGSSSATLYGFAPNDPLGVLLVTSVDAPTMATLLATPTGGAR